MKEQAIFAAKVKQFSALIVSLQQQLARVEQLQAGLVKQVNSSKKILKKTVSTLESMEFGTPETKGKK